MAVEEGGGRVCKIGLGYAPLICIFSSRGDDPDKQPIESFGLFTQLTVFSRYRRYKPIFLPAVNNLKVTQH